ncbi:MAG: hypothetical protein JWM88_1339 [Verrucomicrobia bacterium]|nr:hypothetical protein [Verrucomicrobiota bacterium]
MSFPPESIPPDVPETQIIDEIDIDSNRRLLNRYRYIEQRSMRVLAGWLAKAARFELKCEIGRAIWEDSLHVNGLYLRLREIQSPAFQNPADPALLRLMEEILHAPNELALAVAFWRVLKPALCAAMEKHESTTFPNSDLPSVYAIAHILLDERAQIARIEKLLVQWEAERRFDSAVAPWADYIHALLRDAGGITGEATRPAAPAIAPAVRRNFVPPNEAARDERFTNAETVAGIWGNTPNEADYGEHTSWEFERYSTEMLAAETIGLVMFQMTAVPITWEFFYDLARHLYDEVRHGLMGYEWMTLHQHDPYKAPQALAVFRWRSQFTPVEQYGMLTMGNEANVFPYRLRRLEAHRQLGHRLNEQFVRYDMADETQHVRFGKRWLPEMLKAVGEPRSLKQFTKEILEVWHEQYATGKYPLQAE